ncbi:unnamed protein product [Chrysodeixis includens]|uniref:Uncharacterized protein n=1 Tax=Chrysodeixis includens TaxID=689277 RepID=A0A9P0C0Z6_CHRIL|nr:unnamed protein product [Chrysodeixis includens]
MFSKLLRTTYKSGRNTYKSGLLLTRRVTPKVIHVRQVQMIPPTQYDIPFPKKIMLGNMLTTYWEISPLIISTTFAIALMFCSILWSIKNKVDVVFTSRSRQYLARTMDLRNPTIHKLIIINQKYEPWPEMADVQDKMKLAERRAMMRSQACAHK